jgi:hypothetical protein
MNSVAESPLRQPVHFLFLLCHRVIGYVFFDFLLHQQLHLFSSICPLSRLIFSVPQIIDIVIFTAFLPAFFRRAIAFDLDLLVLVVHIDFI